MKRWPKKKLGELLTIQNGFAFKSELFNEDRRGLPIIRIRDLARGFSETFYCGEHDPAFEVQNGDFLIGMDGEFRCYRWKGGRALLNQRVCRLQSFSESLNSAYVFYGINEHLLTIENNTAFVTVKHLSSKQIAGIEMPVPPLAEQERIVKLMDEADELRKLRAQADTRTAQLIPALFHEMFGDPISNPNSWAMSPVSSFVSELFGGRNVNPAGADEAAGRFRVLKVSAVTWGDFRPEESKPLPAAYEPPASHFVRTGDLLFSRANTTELVAATSYVYETPNNLLLPDKLWRFVWKEPRTVEPLFVWWLFQSPSVRRELGSRATGTGGSMKNISKPKVMTLQVPVPPLPLQKEFAQRVRETRELQATQATSRRRTEDLFQSMLHKAFNGEL